MTRSNRTLTQFAVDGLADFIRDPRALSESRGNTTLTVYMDKETKELVLQVCLFGEPIFEVSPQCLTLHNGGFFDSKGRPSRTTRERLNGLLDAAGDLGLIPKGVRLFLGHNGQKETCLVGKGTTAGAIDEQTPTRVLVRNNLQLLVF